MQIELFISSLLISIFLIIVTYIYVVEETKNVISVTFLIVLITSIFINLFTYNPNYFIGNLQNMSSEIARFYLSLFVNFFGIVFSGFSIGYCISIMEQSFY